MSSPHRDQILSGPISSTIKTLTIPMIWGLASLFSFQLVDVYFISLLGTQALAALSFTLPLTMLVLSMGIGLSIAVTALVSKEIGARGYAQAGVLVFQCLLVVILIAMFLAACAWFGRDYVFVLLGASKALRPLIDGYLAWWLGGVTFLLLLISSNSCIRASGNTRLASRVMTIAAMMNAIFDPIFIFGLGPIPAYGMKGAAMATDLSWFIGSLAILVLLSKEKLLIISKIDWLQQKVVCLQMLALGIPAILTNALGPMFNAFLVSLAARHGEATVAAIGVGTRFEPFALMLAMALTASLPPFVGQNWGAGQLSRVQSAWMIAVRFIFCWQLLVWVLLMLIGGWVAMLFSKDPAVLAVLKDYFFWVPLGYLGVGVAVVTSSMLNALHKTSWSLAIHLIRLFAITLPITWIGSELAGTIGFLIGIGVGNCLGLLLVLAGSKWLQQKGDLNQILKPLGQA